MLTPNEAKLKETFRILNFNARSSKKVIDNRLFSNGKFPIFSNFMHVLESTV